MTIPHQGIGQGRLVPSSHKGSKFRYTIVRLEDGKLCKNMHVLLNKCLTTGASLLADVSTQNDLGRGVPGRDGFEPR